MGGKRERRDHRGKPILIVARLALLSIGAATILPVQAAEEDPPSNNSAPAASPDTASTPAATPTLPLPEAAAANASDPGELKSDDLTTMLNGPDPAQRELALTHVLPDPDRFDPRVILAMSGALFKKKKFEDSVYWMLVGELRLRYEINRVNNADAQTLVLKIQHQYVDPVELYAFAHLKLLRKVYPRAINDFAANRHVFDSSWVQPAMGLPNEADKIVPENQWVDIKKRTIKDFITSYSDVIQDGRVRR